MVDEDILKLIGELKDLLTEKFEKDKYVTFDEMVALTGGGQRLDKILELLSEHHNLKIKVISIPRIKGGLVPVFVPEGRVDKIGISKKLKQKGQDEHARGKYR